MRIIKTIYIKIKKKIQNYKVNGKSIFHFMQYMAMRTQLRLLSIIYKVVLWCESKI
jgi:hypothetical protein